jgi:hypothetical protein
VGAPDGFALMTLCPVAQPMSPFSKSSRACRLRVILEAPFVSRRASAMLVIAKGGSLSQQIGRRCSKLHSGGKVARRQVKTVVRFHSERCLASFSSRA